MIGVLHIFESGTQMDNKDVCNSSRDWNRHDLQKSVTKFLFLKGLFKILHFYSTYASHPLSPPSALKLEKWNFPYRLLILMPEKFPTRFLNFCLGAETWSKNCQNFVLFRASFNCSHNIKARKLIFCT